MLCQECHVREATFRFKGMVSGLKVDIRFCDKCKEEYLKKPSIDTLIPGGGPTVLGNLLVEIVKNLIEKDKGRLGSQLDHRCPGCGSSLREIQMRMKLGCGECYRFFKRSLIPIIQSCQRDETKHVGKKPGQRKIKVESTPVKLDDPEEEIKKLTEEMNEAAKKEDFVVAAQKRDEIKEIRKKIEEERLKVKTTG